MANKQKRSNTHAIGQQPEYWFDEAAADRAVSFIERLELVEGSRFDGKDFILDPWEREIVRNIFGWKRPDGTRRYRRVYIEIPKKNGKSPFCAALMLYLLFADREPGAQVYSAAVDTEQARVVFNTAKEMIERSRGKSGLYWRCKIVDSQNRIVRRDSYKGRLTNSYWKVLSADAPGKHGRNISGLGFDELHAQPNRKLYDVLTVGTGAAREQPLFIFITTAGFDKESVCWELHEEARQVLAGERDDPSLYAVIYGPPDDAEDWDWQDEKNWKAVNPSLGTILKLEDLREEYLQAKGNPHKENEFRRLRLNQWVGSITGWLPLDVWDANDFEPVDPEALRGRKCYDGIDLASNNDINAHILLFPPLVESGKWDILARFWIPQDTVTRETKQGEARLKKCPQISRWIQEGLVETTPGNITDYDYICESVKSDLLNFDIQEIGYDPHKAAQLSIDLMNAGFKMVPINQGFGPTGMSPATNETERMLLGQMFNHGGHPVLRWMFGNVAIRHNAEEDIKIDREKSGDKIDGIAGLIMSVDRAMRHDPPQRKSVYEDHGIRVIGEGEE